MVGSVGSACDPEEGISSRREESPVQRPGTNTAVAQDRNPILTAEPPPHSTVRLARHQVTAVTAATATVPAASTCSTSQGTERPAATGPMALSVESSMAAT